MIPNCPQRLPGTVRGSTFIKAVKARHTMSRPFSGWALSVEQLRRAQDAGVRTVELRVDSGEVLRASLSRILADGKPIHHTGFEQQLLVPLRTWTVEDPAQRNLFDAEA